MTINIDHIADIDKLLNFLRVGAKGKFEVADVVFDELLERVMKWAKEKNLSVQFTTPDGERVAAFTAAGTACGLVTGLMLGLGALPLVVAGVAGAAAGFAAAHVTLVITRVGAAASNAVTIA